MFKILIAEDDRELRQLFAHVLTKNGYTVLGVSNGEEALAALEQSYYDLIISDIMMPGVDGFDFAETVRELDELLLRIHALLRRAGVASSKRLTVGALTMDAEERTTTLNGSEMTAVYKGEELPLTLREFQILFKMLSYPKKTFTRAQLMDEFWDADTSSSTRTVDVCITKLRDKLSGCEDFEIITVHGLGYKAVLK